MTISRRRGAASSCRCGVLAVWFVCRMRRVDCRRCEQVLVEQVPWSEGKHRTTTTYRWFLAAWARRLLFIARERTKAAREQFFELLAAEQLPQWKFVVSDMRQNYLDAVQQRAGQAVHVRDRFHIMQKLPEALDQIRRAETRRLKEDGDEPVLKHSRWCLLKRPENRTAKQTVKMSELRQDNRKSVRGDLHREEFQRFWEARPRRRHIREENGWGRGSPTRPAGRRSSSASGARGPCARGWNRCRTSQRASVPTATCC
ncbi:MAG: transposase [Planctomycetaceae bacterium]